MNESILRIKLAAYLHDPPHKPLVLGRGAGHEAYAERVRQALGQHDLLADGRGERARQADHLAAAADRPNFPENVRADFWRRPVLSHPLTKATDGQPSVFELAGLPSELDAEGITRGVERAAHFLREQARGDLTRLYLLLWRYFPEYLRVGEAALEANVRPEQRLGLLWHALPADTRVPDHSIWDHLAVTAAIAGALPQPAFLVFSLGPVQGFITQARTTRDLWAGSFLLSHLAWAAMKTLCEELGPDCVLYPSLRGQPPVDRWLRGEKHVEPPQDLLSTRGEHERLRLASLPNKFVALVPAEGATDLAVAAAAAARAAWQGISQEVRTWLAGQGLVVDDCVWQRQIDRHLETHWSVLPWPASSEVAGEQRALAWLQEQIEPWLTAEGLKAFYTTFDVYARVGAYNVNAGTLYSPLHTMAQRVFDATKRARPFDQAEEAGYKCTLCGQREPVVAGDAGYREQRAAWADAAQRLVGKLRLEGHERLCAVCLTKRLAPEHSALRDAAGGELTFPSTSTMAALPVKRWLIEHSAELPALDDFLAAIELIEEAVKAGAPIDAALRTSRHAVPALVAAAGRQRGAGRDRAEHLLEVDGEWLFEETYERHLRAVAQEPNAAVCPALGEARRELRNVWAQAQQLGSSPPKPSPYYAILLMDGDRMGRWVSGVQHENRLRDLLHPKVPCQLKPEEQWHTVLDARRLFGPSTHAALSSALLAFSRYTVPWLVEHEGAGRVVYAGGDDLLAFLPLPTALATADALRQFYGRTYVLVHEVSGRVSDTPPPGADARTAWHLAPHMGPQATMSAGLALVHHLYPLGAALEQARQWEREAKERYGRNAVVIGIIRRSGPDIAVGLPWEALDTLQQERQAFARGDLPSRTPYLVRELAESGAAAESVDAQARETLLRGILARRELATTAPSAQDDRLVGVLRALGGDLRRLADFLTLARFLAQEVGDDGFSRTHPA